MSEYLSPVDHLLQAEAERQRQLTLLGERWEALLVATHDYVEAHEVARGAGWANKRLADAGFVDPQRLKLLEAPPGLVERSREGRMPGEWDM